MHVEGLHIVKQTPVVINTTLSIYYFIGVGAGPAGPVLARPLFWQFNETHYIDVLKSSVHAYYNQTTSKVLPKPLYFASVWSQLLVGKLLLTLDWTALYVSPRLGGCIDQCTLLLFHCPTKWRRVCGKSYTFKYNIWTTPTQARGL